MKHFKDIKKKLEWEKYYDPDFNWYNENFYKENVLSADFIREFQDKINWCYVAQSFWLTEKILNEFKDKIDWFYVAQNWNVFTEDFLIKFEKYLSKEMLAFRMVIDASGFSMISDEFKQKYFLK